MRSHPVGFFAHKESNWSNTCRDDPAPTGLTIAIGFNGCGMRRQAAPTHSARQAKLVKPRRIVIGDATVEHLPLPCIRGNFKSLELTQHFKRGTLALLLRSGGQILPAQQPAQELCRSDRLNL